MAYLNCEKCGMSMQALTEAGRYLRRISPKGTEFRGQCAPACNAPLGTADTAIVAAVQGKAAPPRREE